MNGDAIIANGLYIGTGTPNLVNYKLDVLGNAHTSGYSIIDGFVGIGTNNPSYKLQVNDGSLAIYNSTDFKYWTMNYSSGTNTYNINEDGTARMVIENGGNVGLGLTNPAYKLDVNGTIKSSSNLIIDGGATVNNGKGVAYNGNSSANLRIYRFTTANFHAVLGAHASASTSIAFGGGFTSTPYVVVGDIESTGGTVGELDRVILVLRGCVLDTNTGVTTCTAKIINTDNASVDYNITWNCVALGY
ncbi:MAG: hypothetical protein IPP48_02560 [Chitinophagaceae bacterium]|nr:hypothetical protein [Chitinophagaceae bacterium]